MYADRAAQRQKPRVKSKPSRLRWRSGEGHAEGSPVTKLKQLIDKTVTIGTIPSTLAEVQKVIADPESAAKDLVVIIEKDPAVSAKLLRLANSPVMGLRQPMTTIAAACVTLGFRTIRNLVIQASVLGRYALGSECEGFDESRLWDHCFKAAVIAKLCSKPAFRICGLNAEDAYTCGLLHDLGKILLLQSEPGRFHAALNRSRQDRIPLAEAELAVFGFKDHDVCARLAQKWHLGSDLEAAVLRHHPQDASVEASSKAALVHAASTMAHQLDHRKSSWTPELTGTETLRGLGISEELEEQIREQALEMITSGAAV